MSVMHKLDAWNRYQVVKDQEIERLAILRKPAGQNPEWMSQPVKVRRCGRGFLSADGHAVMMNEEVILDAYTAQGLIAMGKAERVQD